ITPHTEPVALDIIRTDEGSRQVVRTTSNSPIGVTILVPAGQQFQVGVRGNASTGHLYALSWSDILPPSCTQDLWEPNNSPTSALSILPNTSIGATLCNNDLDFYRVEGTLAGKVLSAELNYGPDTGPLLLEIWQDGRAITPDRTPNAGRRVVHFRPQAATETWLVVRARGVIGPSGYALSIGAQPVEDCVDDEREGNGTLSNDTIDRAAGVVGINAFPAVLCAGDLDFYDLGTFARGDAIDVSIDFSPGSVNLDAYLFREDITGLFQLAITDNAPEILPTNISQAGRYYVLVIGRTPLDTGDYILRQ
ncbi:MAG: hypothetical protein AAFS10_25055, partial [Myxococcota bacterium]